MRRLDRSSFPGSEKIPTVESLDRITSEPVYARLSSPGFHMAAMDGFAVEASNTFGAGPDSPLSFAVGRNAWAVNTGRPIPGGTNSVIMIEHVNFLDDDSFEIEKALFPGKTYAELGRISSSPK